MTVAGTGIAPPPPWRVVLIDDSPEDRAEVRRLLLGGTDRRCLIRECPSGSEGVQAVQQAADPPDCVILDHFLPDMAAIDVLAELMGPDGLTLCPVLVLTGYDGPELGRQVLRAGAQDYLGKAALSAQGLARAVENAVERFALTRQLRERERALIESEHRLDQALQAAGAGHCELDLTTRVFRASDRALALLGLDPAATPDFGVTLDRIHPEDRPQAEAALDRAIRTGEPFRFEYRRRDTGTWVLAVGERRQGPDGPMLVGLVQDITAQKRVEADLQAARDAAEAASRAKSEFLANMSHEVRTPIGVMLGYTRLLRDGALRPPEVAQMLAALETNGEHLLRIIDDILDLSQVEAGRLQFERVPCSPWDLARETVAALEDHARERRIRLECQASGRLPGSVLLDPTRVRQILVNLVGNAVKFSDPGDRVRVLVGVEPDPAPGADPAGAGSLVLEVDDEGLGMSPDQVDLIFRPFHQAEAGHSRRFGGTGLGLSITRRLVEGMRGTIQVVTALGTGSRFTVRLPLLPAVPPAPAPAPAAAPNPPAARPALPRLSGRLLLAEDNPDNRRVVLHFLRRFGLNAVETAPNGRVALELALAQPYDLILMDLQMPELDGYEATRALRNAGYRHPIVALTAHSMREDRERSLAAGCDDHLTKPLDFDALTATLTAHLRAVPAGD